MEETFVLNGEKVSLGRAYYWVQYNLLLCGRKLKAMNERYSTYSHDLDLNLPRNVDMLEQNSIKSLETLEKSYDKRSAKDNKKIDKIIETKDYQGLIDYTSDLLDRAYRMLLNLENSLNDLKKSRAGKHTKYAISNFSIKMLEEIANQVDRIDKFNFEHYDEIVNSVEQ